MARGYDPAVNRPLLIFLVFVVSLLATGLAAAWWLGPQLALLASAELRDRPVMFLDLASPAGTSAEASRTGADLLTRLVEQEHGQLRYRGTLIEQLDGDLRSDEWQSLTIYSLPAGSDYLRLRTNPRYKKLRIDAGPRIVLALPVQQASALSEAPGSTRVIWLLAGVTPSGTEAITTFLETADAFGGGSAARLPLRRLEGARDWAMLLVVDFPSTREAMAWHRDVRTRTALAIMKARVSSTAGFLFGSPG